MQLCCQQGYGVQSLYASPTNTRLLLHTRSSFSIVRVSLLPEKAIATVTNFCPVPSCISEQRLCLGNDEFDSAVDNIINNWHVECDAFVSSESSSFTTPRVTSLTL